MSCCTCLDDGFDPDPDCAVHGPPSEEVIRSVLDALELPTAEVIKP